MTYLVFLGRFLVGVDAVLCVLSALSLIFVYLSRRSSESQLIRNYFFLFLHDMVNERTKLKSCIYMYICMYMIRWFWAYDNVVCDVTRFTTITGDDAANGIWMCGGYGSRIRGEAWRREDDVALSVWLCEQVLQQDDGSYCVVLLDCLCLPSPHSHLCSWTHYVSFHCYYYFSMKSCQQIKMNHSLALFS